MALIASTTPVRKLPAAQPIAMAIIYVYVARIGATMDLSNVSLETMGAFVAMAYVWIAIHGAFIHRLNRSANAFEPSNRGSQIR